VDVHEPVDEDDRTVGPIAGPEQRLGSLPGPSVPDAERPRSARPSSIDAGNVSDDVVAPLDAVYLALW
jgi:hypothetical protein